LRKAGGGRLPENLVKRSLTRLFVQLAEEAAPYQTAVKKMEDGRYYSGKPGEGAQREKIKPGNI
jgi:hypothetical protein